MCFIAADILDEFVDRRAAQCWQSQDEGKLGGAGGAQADEHASENGDHRTAGPWPHGEALQQSNLQCGDEAEVGPRQVWLLIGGCGG